MSDDMMPRPIQKPSINRAVIAIKRATGEEFSATVIEHPTEELPYCVNLVIADRRKDQMVFTYYVDHWKEADKYDTWCWRWFDEVLPPNWKEKEHIFNLHIEQKTISTPLEEFNADVKFEDIRNNDEKLNEMKQAIKNRFQVDLDEADAEVSKLIREVTGNESPEDKEFDEKLQEINALLAPKENTGMAVPTDMLQKLALLDLDLRSLEAIARVCHEANRAYAYIINEDVEFGEEVAPQWSECAEGMRIGAMSGVLNRILYGNNPEHSHVEWMESRLNDGWVYGPKKDIKNKIHPALVPYSELPERTKTKDQLFYDILSAVVMTASQAKENLRFGPHFKARKEEE